MLHFLAGLFHWHNRSDALDTIEEGSLLAQHFIVDLVEIEVDWCGLLTQRDWLSLNFLLLDQLVLITAALRCCRLTLLKFARQLAM